MNKLHTALQRRLTQFKTSFSPNQAVLLSNPGDIRYFSGFKTLVPEEREALLLLTHHSTNLLHAHFSPVDPVPGITTTKGSSIANLSLVLEKLKKEFDLQEILIDESSLFVNEYHQLEKNLPVKALDRQTIWEMRMVKDELEQAHLKKAAEIARAVMKEILAELQAGQTEQELRELIESKLRRHGSEQPAFPTIVAIGSHAALPHHQPTSRALENNMPVLFDFGATHEGYRSDMTRTVWFGPKPSEKFTEVEALVLHAYGSALEVASDPKGDWTARAVDTAAREIIEEAGYGTQFIHTTGHGVGLDIHEPPSLNWNNETALKSGMSITIEPGIYLENEFGYRHENTVLLTDEGAEELTA